MFVTEGPGHDQGSLSGNPAMGLNVLLFFPKRLPVNMPANISLQVLHLYLLSSVTI